MPEAEQTLLFVYGTLRRGGSNDIAQIAPAARFVSCARVRGRLYDVNGRWPSLVLDAAAGWVMGELYAVPDHAWLALDALEDPVTPQRPEGAYFKTRARIDIDGERDAAVAAASAQAEATLYTANPATTRLTLQIGTGDWITYAASLQA